MNETKQSLQFKWWPSPQDSNEAVQNPQHNLSEEELRKSVVSTDALGLPRPRTGAFASVYKMDAAHKSIALRCFLRNISDQELRYRLISDYVQHDDLDCTVTFDFIKEGIKLNSSWFPILKMEWVNGVPLDAYVKSILHNQDAMRDLCEKFLLMCGDLERAGIAHGDLQHGNILVCGRELKLVDYDGMYVPGMDGLNSNEVGHPNYQHPRRSANHFGAYLDRFSDWVIYASLRSLSIDASLHEELAVGDDCLLFRRDDFALSYYSYAFATLEKHPSGEIRSLAKFIRWQLLKDPSEVPPLSSTVPKTPALEPVTYVAGKPTPVPTTVKAPAAAAGSAAPVMKSAKPTSITRIPVELEAKTPRQLVRNNALPVVQPTMWQWLMLANPLVWIFAFTVLVSIPHDLSLVNSLHVGQLLPDFETMFQGYQQLITDRLVATAVALMLVAFEIGIWFVPGKHRWLVKNGDPAFAIITSKEEVKVPGMASNYYLHYQFPLGTKTIICKLQVPQEQYDLLRHGQKTVVLYDPKNPDFNVLYRLSYYLAKP